MAKKKSNAKDVSIQLKSSLRELKKLGLYNPKNPRKAPTRYGRELVKKYSNVLGPKPKAEVVKVPRSVARELKGQFTVKQGKKGAVAVVPKAGGMHARYSKKEGTIVRDLGDYQMVPIKDRLILMRGGFPQLKRGQAVAIRIGNNYKLFYSLDEVRAEMANYDPSKSTLWQYPYLSKVKRGRNPVPRDEDEEEDYG